MLPTGHREKTLILPNILGIQLSATMSVKMYKKKSCSFERAFILFLLSLYSEKEKSVKKKQIYEKVCVYLLF